MPFDEYEPVEDRLRLFWEEHPMGRITTELLQAHEGVYIVQASVYRGDELRDTPPVATGLAREETKLMRRDMQTSALEICETSAVGRALANMGYAPKGKRPSREEMTSKLSDTGSERSRAGAGQGEVLHGEGGSPTLHPLWQDLYELTDGSVPAARRAVTKANKRVHPVTSQNQAEVTELELETTMTMLKAEREKVKR